MLRTLSNRQNRRLPTFVRRLLPLAAAAALALAAVPSQAQQLIAPTVPIAGYGQDFILAQFSQWSLSHPAATSPLLDPTGTFSHLGDQGDYFFLAGSFDGNPLVRSVTVRPDQTLFLNVMVIVAWPDADETEAELRDIASHVLGTVNSMTITVDGAPAVLPAGVASLVDMRQSSPLFPLTIIENNLGGWPVGVFPAVSVGYLVALEGLPLGNHQVRWTFNGSPTGPFEGLFTLEQDITYNISSVPEPGTWATLALGLAGIGVVRLRRRERQGEPA